MASSGTEAAAAAAAVDGPVLSMMNKRLRSLRKKHNRILQMEERIAQGKPLNKEQEEVLRSKPAVVALIDEYEKLRQPLAAAVHEELARAVSACPLPSPAPDRHEELPSSAADVKEEPDRAIMDILTLVYFGYLFDIKPQSDFAAMMLTRTHERGCCLTYDYVTDDATDLLGEQDLDAISELGCLVASRPVYSGISHKDALQVCLQHAKLWLKKADQPIHPGASVTYAGLREKLAKILASDYFTTTPEMKAPGDVAAAVGKYGSACRVQISESITVPSPMLQTEDAPAPVAYQDKEDEQQEFQPNDVHPDLEVSLIDNSLNMVINDVLDESDMVSSPADTASNPDEQQIPEADVDDQDQKDIEQKEQQYTYRRSYNSLRGGPRGGGVTGGRRGFYSNSRGGGRGGRGRGGGGYQNGQSQYYDSGYNPRNYYNTRGRGGRSGGSASYPSHGGHVSSNVELDASA